MSQQKSTLIIGYGNVDRQDDGVAWHILQGICQRLNRPCPSSFYDPFENGGDRLWLKFSLQLLPEMAEQFEQFDRVCFVDAHTGAIKQDVSFRQIDPEYQGSPFTHHLTPAMSLKLAKDLYQAEPEARLLSVRGYEFGFGNHLSDRTRQLSDQAINLLINWLSGGQADRLNHP